MAPKGTTTKYATLEDLESLTNRINASMDDKIQRLENELHGQIQLVKQRDEQLAVAQAEIERLFRRLQELEVEKRGLEDIARQGQGRALEAPIGEQVTGIQPRIAVPPRPKRQDEFQTVTHQRLRANPNLIQVEVRPKQRSRKTVTKTVDVRAMSYAQMALVNHQEAIETARAGDKTQFAALLDRQLMKNQARANPDTPRVNKNGELLQRTEKMVRLKVNMGWVPKETLHPLQFVRMALDVKKVPYVEDISFLGVGRSWAEWFVDERHVDGVKAWLRASRIDFAEDFNPMTPPPHNTGKPVVDIERTVIWRRALILQRGRFRAIKEAALDGVPERVQEEIQSLASRLRQGTAKGWKWPKPQLEQEVESFEKRQWERTRGFQPVSLAEGMAIVAAHGKQATCELQEDETEDGEASSPVQC